MYYYRIGSLKTRLVIIGEKKNTFFSMHVSLMQKEILKNQDHRSNYCCCVAVEVKEICRFLA